MSEEVRPPEGVKVTDRGLWHWPWIHPAGQPNTTVMFYESSTAGVYGVRPDGTPFEVDGPLAWLRTVEGEAETCVHLTYAEVKNLRDQMNQWLMAHSYALGRPE